MGRGARRRARGTVDFGGGTGTGRGMDVVSGLGAGWAGDSLVRGGRERVVMDALTSCAALASLLRDHRCAALSV